MTLGELGTTLGGLSDATAMAEQDGLILHFQRPDGEEALLVEDNGRVAYAYLLLDGGDAVSSEVWLYNRCAAPDEPEWTSPDKLPFANPRGYVRADIDIALPTSASDFSVEWQSGEDGLQHADILIGDRVVARLAPGAKPGWSLLAAQDGPLAQMLIEAAPA